MAGRSGDGRAVGEWGQALVTGDRQHENAELFRALIHAGARYHVDLHNGQWCVTISAGMVEVARPSWPEPPPRQHRLRHRRRADHPDGDPVVPITQRSRWKADDGVLQQAGGFALADVPASGRASQW